FDVELALELDDLIFETLDQSSFHVEKKSNMLSSRHTDVAPAFPSLSSRKDPIVQRFRQLAGDPASDGGILLDGAHLIREARQAGLDIDVILVAPVFFERAPPEDAALPEQAARSGAHVFVASSRVIDA